MKQFRFAQILAALLLPLSSLTAQVNTSDYLLSSYHLSPRQEAQFSRDGAMSSFWNAWNNGSLDYIDMTPDVNGWTDGGNAFSGIADAELKVRAAFGTDALYLFFEITDNTWMPPAEFDADGVDFLIDVKSSQEIRDANPYEDYVQPSYGWTLTYYSVQYQVNVGEAGATLPSYLKINFFSGSAMSFNRVNLTQLPTDYAGWDLDQASPGANVRQMEWKIPWNWVGCSGGLGSQPAAGTLIAFAGGYNDKDSPTQTGRKSLRWKERDPFNTCNDYPTPHQFCDAWGDIKIESDLDTVNVLARINKPFTTHGTTSVKTLLYDLSGRMLKSGTAAPHSAMMIVGQEAKSGNSRLTRQMTTAR